MSAARRRLLAVVAVGALPWAVVVAGDTVSLFFTAGFVGLDHLVPTTITDYYVRYSRGLPRFLEAYGTGVVLYVAALASAASGVVWREDRRVTAALLVLAGVSLLWFALGFLGRPGAVAVPVATVLLWAVALCWYRPALRAVVTGG
ncbi:MAG: TIGR04206 family protein [Halorientalis sp.]